MDQNKIADALEATNEVIAQFIPLVGVIGTGVRLMVALAKHAGVDVQPFAQEIAAFDANIASAQASIDDYNTRFRTEG